MTTEWENLEDSFRAASTRVVLGLFGLISMPLFVPAMRRDWPVLVGYLAAALVFQYLIKRGIGGTWRVLTGGMVDIAMITFLVHRLGSSSTGLVGVYPLMAMLNSLVAPHVARLLSVLAVISYTALALSEAAGLLPYAPAIEGLDAAAPDMRRAIYTSLVVAFVVAPATLVSERLTRALHHRAAQLGQANARLEELSQRDPLTQLFNRRYFVQRLEEELQRVQRGHSMALLMLDLDKFKHINDQQGHLVGDELLRQIARAISDSTRSVDVVGRFGGDEFVVILTDSGAEDAQIVAERLVQRVRQIGTEFDPQRPVTASVGVASARPDDNHVILLNSADEAAYRAKQSGGDRYLAQDPKYNSSRFDSGPREATG
jgi:diguanylate cyclase (GGDEF)-like protein